MNILLRLSLVARIILHRCFILLCRRRMTRLYRKGEPLTSERMLVLSNLITAHGLKVFRLEDRRSALLGQRMESEL